MKTLRVEGPTKEAVFYAKTGDHLTFSLEHGYYEADLLEAIRAWNIGGTYIDVGAHIGNHTVFFALECRAQYVLAVESNPASYIQLCANVVANDLCGKVRCLNAAVHPEWLSAHVIPAPNGNSGMAGVGPIGPIPAVRLDDYRLGKVGVIKVDTEGASVDVLRTATEILRRDHPLIAAEAIDAVEFANLNEFLSQYDYAPIESYAITPVWLFR